MDRPGRKRTRRGFLEDSAAIMGSGLFGRLATASLHAPERMAEPMATAGRQNVKSFQFMTGEYVLQFEPGMDYIAISRKGEQNGKVYLTLRPGGGDPCLRVLDSTNIKSIDKIENKRTVSVAIGGELDWCHYKVTLSAHHAAPGLVNSRIEIKATREVRATEGLLAGRHPELDYNVGKFNPRQEDLRRNHHLLSPEEFAAGRGMALDLRDPYIDWQFNPDFSWDRLIYYFNSTPGAAPYHALLLSAGALPDLNQLIFYGDPVLLKGTLLYYQDFTSLNPFFKATGTRIRDSVHQPPGCIKEPLCYYMGQPTGFGFDMPAIQKPLKVGTHLLVANSFLHLVPGAPEIHETTKYCGRFIEGIAAIYPYLAKPTPKFIDWPRITEQGFADMAECEKKVGHHVIRPENNLISCRRYAERFRSQRAKRMSEQGEKLWANTKMQLPFGDAWQYLFPLVMAGDYAEEFGSPTAKRVCLEAADDVVEAGRRLRYRFPLRINADFSKPPGVRYEYDCAGSYVYLMLLYQGLTGDAKYLEEAQAAADRLLETGFEFPYEFTTTALVPLALLRLYKLTGEHRYLEAIAIPVAAILRHSWLFNPDYGVYQGRTIFRLNESMTGSYANGWEEATLIHYLNEFLLEGHDILPASVRETIGEVLRWKGVAEGDSLPTLLPDPSIIYTGIPREWYIPVNRAWNIPLEGFGYLEWDDSGLQSKPGRVSQAAYCFGVLPEAAMLLFHPLDEHVTLYVEAPIRIDKYEMDTYRFETLAGGEPFRASLEGTQEHLATVTVRARKSGVAETSHNVVLRNDSSTGRLRFSVLPRTQYIVSLSRA